MRRRRRKERQKEKVKKKLEENTNSRLILRSNSNMVEKILGESKANNTWKIVSYGKSKSIPKTSENNRSSNSSAKTRIYISSTSSSVTAATTPTTSAIKTLQNNKNRNSDSKIYKSTGEKRLHSLKQQENHTQPYITQRDLKKGGNPVATTQNRKRSKLQQQIKRAHRHLLTSGGNDKQQQQKTANCQTNSCEPSSSSAAAATLKKGTQKLKHSKNTKEFHCNKSNNKYLKHNNSNSAPNSQPVQQLKGKTKLKQTNAAQKKLKNFQNDQDSIISSRWCSIEERLDLLDKLLHYCDEEEENAALKAWYNSINREYLLDSTDDDGDGNQEGHSDCDWSWSDMMMSSSSTTATPSEDDARSTISNNSMASSYTSSLTPSSLKRRGHQHHPRFSGTRRPNVPPNVQEILAALYKNNDNETTSQLPSNDVDTTFDDNLVNYPDEPEDDPEMAQRIKASLNLPLTESVTTSMGSNSPTPTDDSSMLDEGMAQTSTSGSSSAIQPLREKKSKSKRDKSDKTTTDSSKEKKSKRSKKDKSKRASACLDSTTDITNATSISDAASAATDEGISIDDDDVQSAEWANLRCTSEAAEIVAEREARRNKNRCADYPGLAFGRSIFSSDTMMKFNIIRNELHNIMNTQLKRVIY